MANCRVKLETREVYIEMPEVNDDYEAKKKALEALKLPKELVDNPEIMINYIDVW